MCGSSRAFPCRSSENWRAGSAALQRARQLCTPLPSEGLRLSPSGVLIVDRSREQHGAGPVFNTLPVHHLVTSSFVGAPAGSTGMAAVPLPGAAPTDLAGGGGAPGLSTADLASAAILIGLPGRAAPALAGGGEAIASGAPAARLAGAAAPAGITGASPPGLMPCDAGGQPVSPFARGGHRS
jgi:hypothetical protein